MKKHDPETYYAYFVFLRTKMLPSEFVKLDILDKAAVIAFADEKAKSEKEREKQLKK